MPDVASSRKPSRVHQPRHADPSTARRGARTCAMPRQFELDTRPGPRSSSRRGVSQARPNARRSSFARSSVWRRCGRGARRRGSTARCARGWPSRRPWDGVGAANLFYQDSHVPFGTDSVSSLVVSWISADNHASSRLPGVRYAPRAQRPLMISAPQSDPSTDPRFLHTKPVVDADSPLAGDSHFDSGRRPRGDGPTNEGDTMDYVPHRQLTDRA
jgi:hypothetical protein